jgi:hypothetical protein
MMVIHLIEDRYNVTRISCCYQILSVFLFYIFTLHRIFKPLLIKDKEAPIALEKYVNDKVVS